MHYVFSPLVSERKPKKKEREYITIAVRIPRRIVEYLDAYCLAFGLTRSEVIRQALVSFLEERGRWKHALG